MTTLTEPELAAMAARLTRARRDAIVDPASASNSVRWALVAKRDGGGSDHGLLDWDAPFPGAPKRWFRTPLGLALRTHLLQEADHARD